MWSSIKMWSNCKQTIQCNPSTAAVTLVMKWYMHYKKPWNKLQSKIRGQPPNQLRLDWSKALWNCILVPYEQAYLPAVQTLFGIMMSRTIASDCWQKALLCSSVWGSVINSSNAAMQLIREAGETLSYSKRTTYPNLHKLLHDHSPYSFICDVYASNYSNHSTTSEMHQLNKLFYERFSTHLSWTSGSLPEERHTLKAGTTMSKNENTVLLSCFRKLKNRRWFGDKDVQCSQSTCVTDKVRHTLATQDQHQQSATDTELPLHCILNM